MNGEKRCPSRWFTPTIGFDSAIASARAYECPINNDEASPGPSVAATASIASSDKFTSFITCGTRSGRLRKCSRVAISGTTPP